MKPPSPSIDMTVPEAVSTLGRTKDGLDKTDPGLLRMLLLAYERAPDASNETFYLTPVAVSYEFEPCDTLKAATLIGARTKNGSTSPARRDTVNLMRGLLQQKGRICLTIRAPLAVNPARDHAAGSKRADRIAELAQRVDGEIRAGYAVWSTNYLAYDLLHGRSEFADRYTSQERDTFNAYIEQRSGEILASASEARSALLELYARPVANGYDTPHA